MNRRNAHRYGSDGSSRVTVTRTRVSVMGIGVFLLCGWMFFLGVTVGRGTAPVHFDMAALQQQAADLRADLITAFTPESDNASDEGALDASDLEFYDKLPSKDEGGINLAKVERPDTDNLLMQKIIGPTDAVPQAVPDPKSAEPENPSSSRVSDADMPSKPPAQTAGDYVIQVAAVKQSSDADRTVADLIEKGFPAFRVTARVGGGTVWYRVRVGTYKVRSAAVEMLHRIQKDYSEAYLLKL